jgi:phospholipid/cholesterol/gamma-HCH transport system ATP-binding protein
LCIHPVCRLYTGGHTFTITMIEVKNLRKSFNNKSVIDGVDAVMKAGQCNLIIGASGSGKTVFMR